MIEIRIHGRGGQGNVVAAYMLAIAAIEVGRYGQAFPSFGAERRGAPVTAFVRIGDSPIRRRCQVIQPAFLIVQDEALLNVAGVTAGLKNEGAILVNSAHSSEELTERLGRPTVALNGTALALEYLGRPMPNTALLAGFLGLTEVLPLEAMAKAMGQRFKGEVLNKNMRLVEEAAKRVPAGLWKGALHAAAA
jgi:pyruvate ferredoxin oxidoreductase gamma subunit